ncbi:hypothetical protein ACQ4PT_049318 [Festuca glaucescens]
MENEVGRDARLPERRYRPSYWTWMEKRSTRGGRAVVGGGNERLLDGADEADEPRSELEARSSAGTEEADVWRQNRITQKSQWKPPEENKLKISVEAGFFAESGEAVAGTVIRDHMGTIVAAASTVLGRCSDVEKAEATAIWTGLKLAINHNLEPDILESDCAVAIAAVNSNEVNLSANWHIYNNIDLLKRVLSNCIFSKVGRNDNGAAHDLACWAKRTKENNVWCHPVPTFISELCKQDTACNSVSE